MSVSRIRVEDIFVCSRYNRQIILVNIHGYNSWLKITVIKLRLQQQMERRIYKNIVVKISTVNVSGHYTI